MGSKHISNYPVELPVELKIKSYSSKADHICKEFESSLNLLQFLDVNEFEQLLYNFACTYQEKNDKGDGNEFDFEVTRNMYSIFVQKKIINHFLVFPNIANDEKLIEINKQFNNLLFEYLLKDFKFYNKKIVNQTERAINDEAVKKSCLLALGFLYCRSTPYIKALFLFNLYSDENDLLKKVSSFHLFVTFLFLIPSNIMIVSIFKLGEEYEKFAVSPEKFKEIYDAYEVKDSIRLIDSLFAQLFADKPELTFDEFLNKLLKNDWIFTPSGIRKRLEETNDVKAEA